MFNRRTLIGILLAITGGSAQTPDGLPKFDTASIKTAGPLFPGQPGGGQSGSAELGHITYFRRNLASLLMQFYGVAIDQIVVPEGPDKWIYDRETPGTFLYNVSVTMPVGTSQQQLEFMMQNLLADRFHLKLHHEQRD